MATLKDMMGWVWKRFPFNGFVIANLLARMEQHCLSGILRLTLALFILKNLMSMGQDLGPVDAYLFFSVAFQVVSFMG